MPSTMQRHLASDRNSAEYPVHHSATEMDLNMTRTATTTRNENNEEYNYEKVPEHDYYYYYYYEDYDEHGAGHHSTHHTSRVSTVKPAASKGRMCIRSLQPAAMLRAMFAIAFLSVCLSVRQTPV